MQGCYHRGYFDLWIVNEVTEFHSDRYGQLAKQVILPVQVRLFSPEFINEIPLCSSWLVLHVQCSSFVDAHMEPMWICSSLLQLMMAVSPSSMLTQLCIHWCHNL